MELWRAEDQRGTHLLGHAVTTLKREHRADCVDVVADHLIRAPLDGRAVIESLLEGTGPEALLSLLDNIKVVDCVVQGCANILSAPSVDSRKKLTLVRCLCAYVDSKMCVGVALSSKSTIVEEVQETSFSVPVLPDSVLSVLQSVWRVVVVGILLEHLFLHACGSVYDVACSSLALAVASALNFNDAEQRMLQLSGRLSKWSHWGSETMFLGMSLDMWRLCVPLIREASTRGPSSKWTNRFRDGLVKLKRVHADKTGDIEVVKLCISLLRCSSKRRKKLACESGLRDVLLEKMGVCPSLVVSTLEELYDEKVRKFARLLMLEQYCHRDLKSLDAWTPEEILAGIFDEKLIHSDVRVLLVSFLPHDWLLLQDVKKWLPLVKSDGPVCKAVANAWSSQNLDNVSKALLGICSSNQECVYNVVNNFPNRKDLLSHAFQRSSEASLDAFVQCCSKCFDEHPKDFAEPLFQCMLNRPDDASLVRVASSTKDLLWKCVDDFVFPWLEDVMSRQERLTAQMLDDSGSSEHVRALLFARLLPLLILRVLPITPSKSASSKLAQELLLRSTSLYEFDQVRRLAAESLCKFSPSSFGSYVCDALGRIQASEGLKTEGNMLAFKSIMLCMCGSLFLFMQHSQAKSSVRDMLNMTVGVAFVAQSSAEDTIKAAVEFISFAWLVSSLDETWAAELHKSWFSKIEEDVSPLLLMGLGRAFAREASATPATKQLASSVTKSLCNAIMGHKTKCADLGHVLFQALFIQNAVASNVQKDVLQAITRLSQIPDELHQLASLKVLSMLLTSHSKEQSSAIMELLSRFGKSSFSSVRELATRVVQAGMK